MNTSFTVLNPCGRAVRGCQHPQAGAVGAYKVGGDGSGAPAVSDDGGTAGEDAQGIDWLRSR